MKVVGIRSDARFLQLDTKRRGEVEKWRSGEVGKREEGCTYM